MNLQMAPLSNEALGHLNYLHSTLTQPLSEWSGFYRALSPSMNFALRYQLAFSTYALAAMSQRTPAYRKPYAEAMRAAIERMLDVEAWGYWRAPETASASAASSGHVAVVFSPHQRVPPGPPSDPITRDNLQYSGHLSTMLGLYEKVTGDMRYDSPFTLHDPQSGVEYTYTHTGVAERIYRQMRANRFGGVCCEPGMAYVPCNNYSMASNTLHDTLHGTSYSEANAQWLRTVRRKMVLRGPAVRGVFGASYVQGIRVATPLAFNFTDAWGLAFLLPFDRALVKKLYPKFRRKVERAGDGGAFVGSSQVSQRMEISDIPINTGFGLILAQGVGDRRLAEAFGQYASAQFDSRWEGSSYLYRGAARTLHATSLYALASAIEPDGEGFTRLFRDAPHPIAHSQPYLDDVLDLSGRVYVCRAEYDAQGRTLHINVRQVGDPAMLKQAEPVEVTLVVKNVARGQHIEVNGRAPAEDDYSYGEDGTLRFVVKVRAGMGVQ